MRFRNAILISIGTAAVAWFIYAWLKPATPAQGEPVSSESASLAPAKALEAVPAPAETSETSPSESPRAEASAPSPSLAKLDACLHDGLDTKLVTNAIICRDQCSGRLRQGCAQIDCDTYCNDVFP